MLINVLSRDLSPSLELNDTKKIKNLIKIIICVIF